MKKNMFSGAAKETFQRARELRNRETHAEDILWGYLKAKPNGYKFRRQHPYSNYILDFYCHALHLVIEVDGSIHELKEVKQNDAERERHLKDNGLIVIRFSNREIETTLEDVTCKIETHLNLKTQQNEEGKR